MKKPAIFILMISALLLAGCASQKPVWQQELENINRQWRKPDAGKPAPDPVPEFKSPRDQYGPRAMVCR